MIQDKTSTSTSSLTLTCITGKHFLAITTQGELYSWGFGDGGVLGNRDNSYCKTPTRVNTLGNSKVHIFTLCFTQFPLIVLSNNLPQSNKKLQ